jgi:hypothetical protein
MAPWRLRAGEQLRAPTAAHRASAAPSATVVVAKIVFVTMLLFLGLTIVAVAPLIVASLLALVAGVAVLASLGRRRIARGRIRVTTRRMRLGGDAAWATLGASSVALLVIALAMPDGYDVVLATLGIIGLAVLRLWAIPRPRLGRTAHPSTAVTLEDTSSQALTGRRARDDPAGLQQTGRRREPIAARPHRSTSLDRAMSA